MTKTLMKNKHGHEGCVMMVNSTGKPVAYDHVGPIEVIGLSEDDCGERDVHTEVDLMGLTREDDEIIFAARCTWSVTRKCLACDRQWTFCTDDPASWPVGSTTGAGA